MTDEPLTIEVRLPSALSPQVKDKLAQAGEQRVAERLLALDPTLWGRRARRRSPTASVG